ncbi:MAG TPA: hypothetical protein ENJ01_03310 [Gammaproteobacteria bacterium]|nr:hypothetical protein [Gammaproteobacteria bacterium]
MLPVLFNLPRRIVSRVSHFFARMGWEFWLSNAVVLASTVLGVFLAARAGLETAVEFEAIRADRDNYYLRQSVREEVRYNLEVAETILAFAKRSGTYRHNIEGIPKFKYFIMETLKESPSTLATPTRILLGVQYFYDDVNDILDRTHSRYHSVPRMQKLLRQRIDRFKKEILPLMDDDLARLRKRLHTAGVALE